MHKRCVVFLGGGSDLALETLKRLRYHQDLKFFVNYRATNISLEELSVQLDKRLILHKADLQEEEAILDMTLRIGEAFGVPDVLVQFASPALEIRRFSETTNLNMNSAFGVQTLAAATVLRKFLPKMKKTSTGETKQVIFLLSEVVLGLPPKGMTEYVVGKYALMGLMRALAAEFECETLRIHALAPGMIMTKFLKNIHESTVEMARAHTSEGLMTADIFADKLAALIQNPDALKEDAIYLR